MCVIHVNNKGYRDDGFIKTETYPFLVCDKCDTELKLVHVKKPSPITGPSCPEGSRKLRFPDYVTTAQDGGKVVSLTHQPLLPPGNTPGIHFC